MKNKISFIGLGKLGLPLSTLFAKNEIEVIGIDKNKELIEKLNNNQIPFYEADLEKNLGLAKGNITFTTKYDRINETDVSIILVNTQIDDTYSTSIVESVLKSICEQLNKSDKYHLIILSSTVMPGDIRGKLIPLIERNTNRKLGIGFGFSYVPDIVKLGSVIYDFENPDVIIIGSSDKKSSTETKHLYQSIPNYLSNNTPTLEMTIEEAEISKISLNAYLVSKISFGNFISNLCEDVQNVNVDNITNAIGFHKPIGHKFLKGGLGFGGTCFPRDTKAFIEFSTSIGHNACHIVATDQINDYQHKNLFRKVMNYDKQSISNLGLAIKPNTPVIKQSASMKLVDGLIKAGKIVNLYDPLCIDEVKKSLSDFPYNKMKSSPIINYCDNIKECFQAGEVVVVCLPDKIYSDIKDDWKSFDEQIILDCWRILDPNTFEKIKYNSLGERYE